MIKIREGDPVSAYALVGLNNTDELIFTKRNTPTETIVELICDEFGITREQLFRLTRVPRIVWARMACVFLLRKYTKMSLPEIAKIFKYKHHASVLHAMRWSENSSETDPYIRASIRRIELKII